MKAWKPGNLVCDDVDEHFEPLDPKGRTLAAKTTLTIRLAMHRAELKMKAMQMLGLNQYPMCRCIVRPIEPTE